VLAFMSRPELLILDEPTSGIDPKSPLGYLWIGLYANVYPWMLMAFGVVLGVAAIAGDEDTGGLEYLLAWPVTRSTVTLARFASMLTILASVAAASGWALAVDQLPLFDLNETAATTTAPNGTVTTSPGATAADVFNGTFSAFAVGLGLAGGGIPTRHGRRPQGVGARYRDRTGRRRLRPLHALQHNREPRTADVDLAVALVRRRRDADQRPDLERRPSLRPRDAQPARGLVGVPPTRSPNRLTRAPGVPRRGRAG